MDYIRLRTYSPVSAGPATAPDPPSYSPDDNGDDDGGFRSSNGSPSPGSVRTAADADDVGKYEVGIPSNRHLYIYTYAESGRIPSPLGAQRYPVGMYVCGVPTSNVM